jgi:hypothetical protein
MMARTSSAVTPKNYRRYKALLRRRGIEWRSDLSFCGREHAVLKSA